MSSQPSVLQIQFLRHTPVVWVQSRHLEHALLLETAFFLSEMDIAMNFGQSLSKDPGQEYAGLSSGVLVQVCFWEQMGQTPTLLSRASQAEDLVLLSAEEALTLCSCCCFCCCLGAA